MEKLGALIGEAVKKPATVWLTGDLGAGKTCFTRGFARGLGVPDEEPVTSPSYALMNHYRGRLDLYHFDLYRLLGISEVDDIGLEECLYGDGVTVVEWAERVPRLEGEGFRIEIVRTGETDRSVSIRPSGAHWEGVLTELSCRVERVNERF